MAAPKSSLAAAAILALWPGYGLALPIATTKPRPGDPYRRGVYRKQRRNKRRNEDVTICYVICNIISQLKDKMQ